MHTDLKIQFDRLVKRSSWDLYPLTSCAVHDNQSLEFDIQSFKDMQLIFNNILHFILKISNK